MATLEDLLSGSTVLPQRDRETARCCQCNKRRFSGIFFFPGERELERQVRCSSEGRVSRCAGRCDRGPAGSTSPRPGRTSSCSGARRGLLGAPATRWSKSRRSKAECGWNRTGGTMPGPWWGHPGNWGGEQSPTIQTREGFFPLKCEWFLNGQALGH